MHFICQKGYLRVFQVVQQVLVYPAGLQLPTKTDVVR